MAANDDINSDERRKDADLKEEIIKEFSQDSEQKVSSDDCFFGR